MTDATTTETQTRPKPKTLLLFRLLSLLYDFWPVAAVWMLVSTVFTVAYTASGHGLRENIAPFSLLQWLLWLCCWLASGAYAVISWSRGGQTLGMRPWRLHVTGTGDTPASFKALSVRYIVGTVSLLRVGIGGWWAWLDRDRLTWHDRASGTRMVRVAKT